MLDRNHPARNHSRGQLETEADVERIVEPSADIRAGSRAVAKAGKWFAERCLAPASALAYISLMLLRFAQMQ